MSNTNPISTAGKIDKKSDVAAQVIEETKAIAEEGFFFGLLIGRQPNWQSAYIGTKPEPRSSSTSGKNI